MATVRARTLADGRYVVESRIGEGGQAAVFRIRDQRLSVERALKVLLPKYATKQRIRDRFAAEARAMALLEHPNIVRVYDVDTDGTLPYMVMELVTSGSLANWLEVYGPFPTRQAVQVAIEVCAGAGAAHAASIIHRDIKPQNVLVAADGTCKITDFGIARSEDGHATKVGAALGTQGYMAPEQSRDATKVDPRSDVYSIGVTIYVLLTCTDPVEWLSGRRREVVPPPLRAVLERATHPLVAHRYPTASALAHALEGALERLPPDELHLPLGRDLSRRGLAVTEPIDDWADIEVLLDSPEPRTDHRTTWVEPEQRRSYAMPRPVEAANTPAWVDRSVQPAPIVPMVIGVDRALAPTEPTWNGEGVPGWLGWLTKLAPVAVMALGLCAGGWITYEVLAPDPPNPVEQTRARLETALQEEHDLIDALVSLGADRSTLDLQLREWKRSPEPARTEAALRLVETLDRTSESLARPGHPPWENVNAHVRRLRVARDAYQRAETHEDR
ncbi:MAG: serine/threonine-protein kinase [Myxococcota bacterium]